MTEFKVAPFQSHSQAGQDLFCKAMLIDSGEVVDPGTVIEIGACHATERSNSKALEELGWRSILIDNDRNACEMLRKNRKGFVVEADATTVNWAILLADCPILHRREALDYLSLDVDAASLDALRNFPIRDLKVRVISYEHDFYRFGDTQRTEMRRIVRDAGFDIICQDVMDNGCVFEDWACRPELVDMSVANRFRSSGLDWREIFERANYPLDSQR